MIDKNYWEEQLKKLNYEDLNEVARIVSKLKKETDTRPEFVDMLRKWRDKYPCVKYFYIGQCWKGDYECAGEWGTEDWTEYGNMDDMFDELKDYGNEKNNGDVHILKEFEDFGEFENTIINTYVLKNYDSPERKEFDQQMRKAKNVPKTKLTEAQDLYNGHIEYRFLDIETGNTLSIIHDAW